MYLEVAKMLRYDKSIGHGKHWAWKALGMESITLVGRALFIHILRHVVGTHAQF